jgi:hypothetical protein
MTRLSLKLVLPGTVLVGAAALHLWTAPASASSDMGCTPSWKLASGLPLRDGVGDGDICAGRAMLAPGNDTRINLLLLMRSLQVGVSRAPAYPKTSPDDASLGRSFFSWKGLRAALWPQDAAPQDYATHACTAPPAATAAFARGLAQAALSPAERKDLYALRATVGCPDAKPASLSVSSAAGRDYLAYLTAADAFYRKDYAAARDGFAALSRAHDPWVAETSAYMAIRVAFGQAMAHAFDQYGNFNGTDKLDAAAVKGADAAIAAYLKAWPKGAYAASAQGLTRRVMWLAGDRAGLAHVYEHLLATTPADSVAAADLIEEIDNKLMGVEGKDIATPAHDTPLLLATMDLLAMRRPLEDKPMTLSEADLDAQAATFAARPDLLAYLRAARAYYTGQDGHRVLALIPDAARGKTYAPLGFSGQMLRGMALARLGDTHEVGFWRDLIGGAAPVYQRPLVELGLAQTWTRQGRMDAIFAPASPITDSITREMLLQSVAPPAILRLVAQDSAQPRHERDVARFALLYKGLTRGAYGDVARDLALVPQDAKTDAALWNFQNQSDVPVGIFTRGKWSDGYPCVPLAQTVGTLSRLPHDRQALLCLGDFYRLNGLDGFVLGNGQADKDTLDGGPDLFPGKPTYRGSFYAAILADKGALPDERAYALFRAINCYAPSGYNACGGADVPKEQRKAWYTTLKQSYPASRWAKALRFYW